MAFLRESGKEKQANEIGISKEKQITNNLFRHRSLERKIRSWLNPLHLWRVLIGWLVGYGYKPERAILFLLCLLVFGSFMFGIAAGETQIFPTRLTYIPNHQVGSLAGFPAIKAEEYPEFSPIMYSIELATPLPNLGQEDNWEIKGNSFFEAYKWFRTIFGWLLSFLIVLSPTKLLRRE